MATRALLAELIRTREGQDGEAPHGSQAPQVRRADTAPPVAPVAPVAQAARVVLESVGGVEAARRVRAGEVFDLVVLAADALDALAAEGLVLASSRRAVVDSAVAVAVPAGHPPPDIGSEAALQQAVRAAGRIGYSTGPSGTALLALFQRWGWQDELAPRLVQARPGVPVGHLLAQGEVDLGFQQFSELMDLPGINLLGGMPPGLEIITTFAGAVGRHSSRPEAAQALLDHLASPGTAGVKRRHGMLSAP